MRTVAPAVREMVAVRDAGVCRFCLSGWQVEHHHRQGRRGPLLDRLSNIVSLCREHHAYATTHPQWAYERGLSVRRNSIDQPDEVPFVDSWGIAWALTDDGQLIRLGPQPFYRAPNPECPECHGEGILTDHPGGADIDCPCIYPKEN